MFFGQFLLEFCTLRHPPRISSLPHPKEKAYNVWYMHSRCEIGGFFATHLRKLLVVVRSRVLAGCAHPRDFFLFFYIITLTPQLSTHNKRFYPQRRPCGQAADKGVFPSPPCYMPSFVSCIRLSVFSLFIFLCCRFLSYRSVTHLSANSS